ncbi:MAG: hypothetical protein OXF22_04635 [Anaerolineaceae bacterium]|nr:hypothetical protein [Anaerolineaceae bacterium]
MIDDSRINYLKSEGGGVMSKDEINLILRRLDSIDQRLDRVDQRLDSLGSIEKRLGSLEIDVRHVIKILEDNKLIVENRE